MNIRLLRLGWWVMPILMLGCTTGEVVAPPFDGVRAFSYLKAQVKLGPRVPGSQASADARTLYRSHFESNGLTVDSQKVAFINPYGGDTIPLVNLIARANPDTKVRIFIAAHYDCRPRAEHAADSTRRDLPIDGANDGASGVAVLMEFANLIKERRPDEGIDLIMLDGEDWGKSGDLDYYSLGAKALARTLPKDRYRFGIVLDMIGDRDQLIYREGYSEQFAKPLNDLVWSIAARLQITTFRDSVKHSVIDDHLPFNVAGIPTINLIDFDYPFWHTDKDTPDKCSPEALFNVGRIVAHIMYNRNLWPKN
jgi:Zn-dependent M28 family amino/carboxypeptidase